MILNKQGCEAYIEPLKSGIPVRKQIPNLRFRFDYCPKINIGQHPTFGEKIITEFYRGSNLTFTTEIYQGMYSHLFPRFVNDWRIVAKKENGEIIGNYALLDALKKEKVRINFDSSSLGDTLAWMPYVILFKEKYQVKDLVVASFYNSLFESEYPDIKFETPNYYPEDYPITIGLGWYVEDDRNIHVNDPRTIPLQKVASDLLGVGYFGEIKPKVSKRLFLPSPSDKRYVCIATESTAGAKLWHFPGGWQALIDMLVSSGFDVVNIHRGENHFKNVIDRTGSLPLEERISDLMQCEFFVGLGSGLSWLAWALDIPVVLISGFSLPFCEFSDKTLRIINTEVCHGCFNNTEYKFDKSWWWCPAHSNTERQFECTKTISPDSIFERILMWDHYPKSI